MGEHPKDRPIEPADPLEGFAAGAPGDPLLMLDCIVEEYARMGFGAQEMLELFERPDFGATRWLREQLGPEATRARIYSVLSRCGVLRVTNAHPAHDPGTARS